MKTYRIPSGGVRHYVQGRGIVLPGEAYMANAPLADGDVEEVQKAEKPKGRKAEVTTPPPLSAGGSFSG